MYHLVESLRKIAILTKPAMEETSKEIIEQLGLKDTNLTNWDSIIDYPAYEKIKVTEKGTPLFIRLDSDKEIEYLRDIITGK